MSSASQVGSTSGASSPEWASGRPVPTHFARRGGGATAGADSTAQNGLSERWWEDSSSSSSESGSEGESGDEKHAGQDAARGKAAANSAQPGRAGGKAGKPIQRSSQKKDGSNAPSQPLGNAAERAKLQPKESAAATAMPQSGSQRNTTPSSKSTAERKSGQSKSQAKDIGAAASKADSKKPRSSSTASPGPDKAAMLKGAERGAPARASCVTQDDGEDEVDQKMIEEAAAKASQGQGCSLCSKCGEFLDLWPGCFEACTRLVYFVQVAH
jgi:hypothetical protein